MLFFDNLFWNKFLRLYAIKPYVKTSKIVFTMKNFYLITIVACILCCTSCSESLPGTNVISGRLLNNCEDQEPVANQLLYFYVDYDTPDKERIAYTDDNGRFEYSFEGPAESESVLGGTIRTSQSNVILAGIGGYFSKADAGDIYLNTPTHIPMTFRINGKGFLQGDSLFIAKQSIRFPTIKLEGPFENIITDTLWTRYATTAAGTMESYASMNKPEVRRLHGRYGSLCNWEIKRNGKIIKSGGDEVVFDACTQRAEMIINLNED